MSEQSFLWSQGGPKAHAGLHRLTARFLCLFDQFLLFFAGLAVNCLALSSSQAMLSLPLDCRWSFYRLTVWLFDHCFCNNFASSCFSCSQSSCVFCRKGIANCHSSFNITFGCSIWITRSSFMSETALRPYNWQAKALWFASLKLPYVFVIHFASQVILNFYADGNINNHPSFSLVLLQPSAA